jgi:hypothetical protein
MRHGDRREAAHLGDPHALLARYAPAPDRTARVVLHPRLTFIPCDREYLDAAGRTFAVDAAIRVFGRDDVEAAGRDVKDDADRPDLDAVIAAIEGAAGRRDVAAQQVTQAEARLAEARDHLDRVAAQRATACETIAAARQRLAQLEGTHHSDADLRRELEHARASLAAAESEHAQASAHASRADIDRAQAALAAAERELETLRTEARRRDHAVDSAAHHLEVWAAQRAVDETRFDLERLEAAAASAVGGSVATAQQAVDAARTRVTAIERALHERAVPDIQPDASEQAAALRAQIAAVERTLDDAATSRRHDLEQAEQVVDRARHDLAALERELHALVADVEPGGIHADLDSVLERLRRRLEPVAPSEPVSPSVELLQRLAEAPEALIVLVEPFETPPRDVVDALVTVATLKRVVVVTEDTSMLRDARELDPAIGAVRQPIVTGAVPSLAFARANGDPT